MSDRNANGASSGGQAGEIDESLYSRQLYVLGKEAMQRMSGANVLISGVGGLGLEIAKNVVLAGVKSVTIQDDKVAQWSDLSSQYYLSESDIGQNRATVTVPKLQELNSYVNLNCEPGPLTNDLLDRHNIIVLTDATLDEQLKVNAYCRSSQPQKSFIGARIAGLAGSVFCDFGDKFVVYDTDGNQPVSVMISSVDEEGVVTCLDESRHGLEDGDYVSFKEVEGMPALNDSTPKKITVKGPYTFSIGDVTGLGTYVQGGIVTQVKMPKEISFKSLETSLKTPEFTETDFAKFGRPQTLHLCFQALSKFQADNGRLPGPRNAGDAAQFLTIVKAINEAAGDAKTDEIDEKTVELFSFTAAGNLAPMCAVFGGMAAQEVLKASSGKFGPIQGFLYFDAYECLPEAELGHTITEEDVTAQNNRYDGQTAVFGKKFQEMIGNARVFTVGAGAIGCELLKIYAATGLASGADGKVFVTDMDAIERSNLNRQFLFRPKDVGSFKSEVAAEAVKAMNPNLNIETKRERVGQDTENIFSDDFFDNLTLVCNALDNVDARLYMDRRCVYYRKPLLESGTLGTSCNTQVVIPHLTESYSSSQDPPEKSIPICTLKNFPNQIQHTIQWARDLFEGIYTQQPESAQHYIEDPDFVDRQMKQSQQQALEALLHVQDLLQTNKPHTFEDCVSWARLKFEELFHNQIKQLLYNFPPDQMTSTGQPFWSGPKRVPSPMVFDLNNPLHFEFVRSGAVLRAENFGIEPEPQNIEKIKQVVDNMMIPEFQPKAGVKIQANENDESAPDPTAQGVTPEEVMEKLPNRDQLSSVKITPLEFEKDDDTNFHMEFITSASNLRAANYRIDPADKTETKRIAGRIIPAIATTTAMVVGFVGLEMFKVIWGQQKIESYKNGYCNLALPLFTSSEPMPAPKLKYYDTEWSLWDRFDLKGPMTLKEFIDYFQDQKKLEVGMVSAGNSMLFSFFMPGKKREERMGKGVEAIYEEVTKKSLPEHQQALVMEIMCNDDTGEDVEVPYVRYQISK
eukprot:Clim_evm13s34 gene=Clim_evmTU13s34